MDGQRPNTYRRRRAQARSWNDNGYYVEYTVGEGGLKAWSGSAAGQKYRTSSGGNDFYLPGGGEQLFITPDSISPSSPKLTDWPEP